MSASSWQSAVFAARASQKPLYLVESVMGNTVEATTSIEAARTYVKEAWNPEHFRIFKQHNGHLEVVA